MTNIPTDDLPDEQLGQLFFPPDELDHRRGYLVGLVGEAIGRNAALSLDDVVIDLSSYAKGRALWPAIRDLIDAEVARGHLRDER